jgi:hypothetical protein
MITQTGNKIIRCIHQFFFSGENVSPRSFIFFRISLGLFILLHFLAILGDMDFLFGFDPIFPAEITDLYIDSLLVTNRMLLELSGLEKSVFVTVFNVAYITLSVFIIAGFATRLSVFIMLILHISLIKSNVFFNYGVDYFTSMSLFYLLIFPVNEKFSIDALLFRRKPVAAADYQVYLRLLQLHLCLAYLFSGGNKLMGYNWWNGEAVWKAINLAYSNIDFQLNFRWLSDYPLVLAAMGWFVIIIELFYPVIMFRRFRKAWLYGVIGMHLGIAIVINLYFFSVVMIIWNIAAFYNFGTPSNKNIS